MDNLLSLAKNSNQLKATSDILKGGGSVLSGFMDILNANTQYSLQKTQNKFLSLQASEIELKSKQAINSSIQNFSNAIGNLDYLATRSGVKNTSGTVRNNIESSAINLGNDNAKQRRYAENQANSLRAQESIQNKLGKSQQKQSQANGLFQITSGLTQLLAGK